MPELGFLPEMHDLAPKPKTPARLRLALRLNLLSTVKEPRITGKENLKKIPKNREVVVAVTHLSDIEVGAGAYAVSDGLNVGIANDSTHHSWRTDLIPFIGMTIAGRKNFSPIDARSIGGHVQEYFNPDNYEVMRIAMDRGKAMVIAAHNATYDGKLPDSPGYGALYLAQLTNAVILPVAVDGPLIVGKKGLKAIIADSLKGRPDLDIAIGEPLDLEKISVEELNEIMKKNPNERTKEDHVKFREITGKLKMESSRIMKSLANMLPPEKRGIWGEVNSHK